MNIVLFLTAASVTFAYVFLRAFQQLNVVGGHYWRVVPTSLAMGVGDVALIWIAVASDTLLIGITNGLAGALGCMTAMYLNKRMRKA